MDNKLNVAFSVDVTESEGPGKRFAIWLQGCNLACPDCCNPEMWSEEGGSSRNVDDILSDILKVKNIEGVSILGGEPLLQDGNLWELAKKIQENKLSVMLYTGYTSKEIKENKFKTPLYADIIVAGRYEKDLYTEERRWIGSKNQELIFVTDFYSEEDEQFYEKNSAEIKLNSNGELTIVGFPFPRIRENFRKKIVV